MTVIDTKKNYFLVRFDDSDNSFAFGTHEMLTSPWGGSGQSIGHKGRNY